MRLSLLVALCIVIAALASINGAHADEPQDDMGVLTTPDNGEATMPFANLTYTGVGRFVWNDGRSYAISSTGIRKVGASNRRPTGVVTTVSGATVCAAGRVR
jgi:hypothetical protein